MAFKHYKLLFYTCFHPTQPFINTLHSWASHQYLCTAQSQEFSVRWEGEAHKQEMMIPQESHSAFGEHGWAEHPTTQRGFQCLLLDQLLPWGKHMGSDSLCAPVSPEMVGISCQGCRQIIPEPQTGLHWWSSQVQLMYLIFTSQSWRKTTISVPIL